MEIILILVVIVIVIAVIVQGGVNTNSKNLAPNATPINENTNASQTNEKKKNSSVSNATQIGTILFKNLKRESLTELILKYLATKSRPLGR